MPHPALRDTCEQNDGLQGYGWKFYDARVGGSQTVHDTQLQLDLNTDFLKTEDGGSWAVRITGTPKPGAADVKTTVILHAAVEMADSNKPKSLGCENHTKAKKGVAAACRGEVAGLGRFEFQVLGDAMNNVVHDTVVKSVQVLEDEIWKAKCKPRYGDPGSTGGLDVLTRSSSLRRLCQNHRWQPTRRRRCTWQWKYALCSDNVPGSIPADLHPPCGRSTHARL